MKSILRLNGEFVLFLFRILQFSKIMKRRFEIFKQAEKIGNDSLLLIIITSAFTGLVTAVQASYQSRGFISLSMLGTMIGKTSMLELAPVLTALVITGKVGGSITAEIATMNVTEQLDALKSMGVFPEDYLYMPRILAGTIMLPILTIISELTSIMFGFFISNLLYSVSANVFFSSMKTFFKPADLWGGLIKALFFGFIITSISCFEGSKSRNGAEGVGKATTTAVVFSSIFILCFDFLITAAIFS
jgi:phospholipid/cholesterol/gamma-HCH transport system permease protein